MFSSSSTTSNDTLRSPESGTGKFSLAIFCLSVAVAIRVVRRSELKQEAQRASTTGSLAQLGSRRIVQENRLGVQAQTWGLGGRTDHRQRLFGMLLPKLNPY